MLRRLLGAGAVVATLFASATAMAADAGDMEGSRLDALKSGYLFNFAKLVEWPPAFGDVLPFCFMGGRGVYDALAVDAASKRIGARGLSLRAVDVSQSLDGCALLYIDASTEPRVRALMGHMNTPTLVVSDADEFVHHGGMIQLFNEGNRLRFRVNLDNARAAGVKISSALLQLASSVEQEHTK
jgi:YfiR/HmsC-like